jgi:hypothetical protein
LTLVLLAALLFATCDKDVEIKCTEFRTALAAGDEDKILETVNQYIALSFLQVNSSQNFDKLAKYFKDHCNLAVSYKCFQCVDTNPPLSYMTIQFLNGPVIVQKTLVIWDDPQENKMKAVGVN